MIWTLAIIAGMILAFGGWLAWEAVHDVNEPQNDEWPY